MSTRIVPSNSYVPFLSPPVPRPAPDHIKDILPDYRITEVLGSGGFADVYAGTDRKGNNVAIKIPQVKFDKTIDGSIYDKFQKEANVWSKLEHSNIVGFYSADDQPLPHIVMEMMDRGSLQTLMKKHRLTVGEAIHIMLQVLEGLSHAHHMAIVHRDLKPENILFTKDGTPKITDWGIGKFLASTRMTETIGIKGTLNYCAPEQFDKKKYGKIDWQTDIFQAGVLFYEMLTEVNPFEGEDMPEVYGKVMNFKPEPPSALNPDVPKELDDIIMKALKKSKKKRWVSGAVMLDHLQPFIEKMSTHTAPTPTHSTPKRLKTKEKKRPSKIITIVSVVVVVVLIGSYLWYNWERDKDSDGDGVRDRDDIFPNDKDEWMDRDGDGVGDNSDIALNDNTIQEFSDLNFEWVDILSGTFWMGSFDGEGYDDEYPRHKVTISKEFQMLKYEVTQAQWEAIMGNIQNYFKARNNPVELVTWTDCQSFISKLNELDPDYTYRLPTEAEWEYACRAGSTTTYCFGNDSRQLENYAWYEDNSLQKTHPVGQKLPNAWGLYDMHGNVGEWCQDNWHDNYTGAPTDGSAWEPGSGEYGFYHVTRGGSWNFDARMCGSSARWFNQDVERIHLGLRLVREES